MLGAQSPDSLPDQVILGVRELTAGARKYLGSVRTEWAHDGTQVWLLQLHLSAATYAHGRLSPGDAQEWLTYNVADGLAALRSTVAHAEATSSGVLVVGSVGLTSHVGDLLRLSLIHI